MSLDRPSIAYALALASSACYSGLPNGAAAGTDGGSPTSGSGEGEGTRTSTDPSGVEAGDDAPDPDGGTNASSDGTGSTGDSAEPEPSELARDILLTRVEANQAVAVALFADGMVVEPEARNADLVYGRDTIVRAYWELEAGFEPRMIEAHLRLVTATGEVEDLVQTRHIDGPPDERELDGTFTWLLPAESVQPGLSYSVGLHEIEGTPPAPVGASPPRVPLEGEVPLGVAPEEMILRAVFIPLQSSAGGGVQVTAANQQRVADRLLAEYPVQSVDIVWRDPWVVTGQLVDQSEGWGILEAAREQDDAAPNVNYHLLLDEDSCCADNGQWSWGGIGGLSDDSPNAANWGGRDAMSKVDGNGEWSTGVIVHELGHNHGRPHAPCGNPGGPDPQYPAQEPYTEAGIGVQGYDIVDARLYNPFPTEPPMSQWDNPYKDRMSYCWPNWWSDYNWQHLVVRTRELTSWDTADAPGDPTLGLRGFVRADGRTTWSVVELSSAPPPAPPTDAVVRLREGSRVAAELAPHVVELSEGGRFLGVALPPDAVGFDRVELELGRTKVVVPRPSIRGVDRL